MGASSSTPHQPPLIALNGGTFGKHNNILIPAEAFAGSASKLPRSPRGKRRAEYDGRRRGPKRVWSDGTPSEDFDILPLRGGGRRGKKTGMGYGYGYPDMGGVSGVPLVPLYYDGRGMRTASAPNLPGYGVGPQTGNPMKDGGITGYAPGVGGKDPYGYAAAQGAQMPPPLRATPQKQRKPVIPPGVNEIPQGIFEAQAQGRAGGGRKAEPLTSDRINRTQSANRKAGPSGQEWLGADPFLDACTCTTNCNCRKGARVLYRAQAENDSTKNTWGEIRYVMKDDVGRDCGDHGRCRWDDESGSDGGMKKGKKKAEKSCEELNKTLKEVAGHLANMNMKYEVGSMGQGAEYGTGNGQGRVGPTSPMSSEGCINPQFVNVPPQRYPETTEGIDPRMMQRMNGGNPYNTHLSPQMSGRRPNRMQGMNMPLGGLGDLGSMPPFEDEIPFPEDMDFMSMDIPPQRPLPGGSRHPARPPRRKPRGGLGGRRPWPEMDPNLDYGPPPPRRGNMNGPRSRPPGRYGPRPPPGPLDDDFDDGSDSRFGGPGLGAGRRPYGMDDEDDWQGFGEGLEDDLGMLPRPGPRVRRGGGSGGTPNGGPGAGRGRPPNQARVDEEDDDY